MREKWNVFYGQNFQVMLLLFMFVTMTMGCGNSVVVACLCVCLSLMGLFTKTVKIDLIAFCLMIGMVGFAALSSWQTTGVPLSGYVSKWLLFLILYLWLGTLSDMESRRLKQYVVYWVAVIAVWSVLSFVFHAVQVGGGRLGGVLGNPNSAGIFLVIGWFLLEQLLNDNPKLLILEPLVLVVCAMTLSMGSFLSMGVALLYLTICKGRVYGVRYALLYLTNRVVRIGLCFWIGFLFYWSSRAMYPHWLCVLPFGMLMLAILTWRKVVEFLQIHRKFTFCMAVCGLGLLSFAVYLRPSSFATFAERLEMMQVGVSYVRENPVTGVGPYRWRGLDYSDGGKYFNTWYIHNAFLHVGVEVGVLAMLFMTSLVIWYFYKHRGKNPDRQSGAVAFLVHSLLDVGFFFEVIPVLMLLGNVSESSYDKVLSSRQKNILFGVLFLLSLWYVLGILPFVSF